LDTGILNPSTYCLQIEDEIIARYNTTIQSADDIKRRLYQEAIKELKLQRP